MSYDADYYAQGKGSYRLHKIFRPLLSLLYFWSVQSILKRCKFSSEAKLRALDVGAGRGEFLYYLRKKGWEVVGTQISQNAIEAAKQFYNISLLKTDLPRADELGKFDLVTYWHTFEHLENPKAHLDQLGPLLRDENSCLIIEIPNPESFGASICSSAWLGSDPPHHINMLSRPGFLKMAQEVNLDSKRTETFSFKFSVPYLYSALCGWLSKGGLDFDFFMEMLKKPGQAVRSKPGKGLLLVLISCIAIPVSLLLVPIGIWSGYPEILRFYIKKSNSNIS